jgi:tRNA threonylcarbamoyladenosine biosynthesis protein TsaE
VSTGPGRVERRADGQRRELVLTGGGTPYAAQLVERALAGVVLSWEVLPQPTAGRQPTAGPPPQLTVGPQPTAGPPPRAWLDAACVWAGEVGVLDLRARAGDPADGGGADGGGADGGGADGGGADGWQAAGFAPLRPGASELVLPVPQVLDGVAATRALGARLARLVRAGDLLVLSGPLGAGKTALAAGLGEALGVRGAVTSPTFVLARVHRGPLPLVHVDAYRLITAGQELHLDDLDLDAALEDSVTVVEWGEGVVEALSPSRLTVELARPSGSEGSAAQDRRTASVRVHGDRWSVL